MRFLSFYAWVVKLEWSFLRNIFNQLRRFEYNLWHVYHLSGSVYKDLAWWVIFLNLWTKVQIIRSYRKQFIIHIDVNDLKNTKEWWSKKFFTSRMKTKHKSRYINWKEIYAILYILVKWNLKWKEEKLIIIYDNDIIIQVINKCMIKGNILMFL